MSQSKVTAFYRTRKNQADKTGLKPVSEGIKSAKVVSDFLQKNSELTCDELKNEEKVVEADILRTPKRNLSYSEESQIGSSTKKRKVDHLTEVSIASGPGAGDKNMKKTTATAPKKSARKKLVMGQKDLGEYFSSEEKATKTKNVSEMKEKLSSGKMEELQSKLEKFDKALSKFKNFQENKSKVSCISKPLVSVAASECNSVVVEKEEKPLPAYVKFRTLATAGDPHLSLPFKYKVLAETFRCSDTVVSMLNNRKERCTFEKLQNGVQDMSKRNFTKMHLGQIKTVFPTAYEFVVEKSSFVERKPGAQNQLVVVPNLNNNLSGESKSNDKKVKKTSGKLSFQQMTPAILVERRNIFHSSILNIAKKYHQEFLLRLKPQIVIPPHKLTKWHPKFMLDSVPEIVPLDLPDLPGQQQVVTAKDALEKMRGTKYDRIEKALKLVAEKYNSSKEEPQKPFAPKGKQLDKIKGISNDLLQRIRARESVKILSGMTEDPKVTRRKQMLEKVPELVRILRTYFITERKVAISLEDGIQKISDSYHTFLNPDEVKEHLQLIAEIFPRWLTIIPIRKCLFLKINKNEDINMLLANMPKA